MRFPEEDRTSRPMEGAFGPKPLGHSVLKVHLGQSDLVEMS